VNPVRKEVMKRSLALGAVLLGLVASAAAQEFPARSIRMIMPFGPGGPTDITARLVAQHLSQRVGQPVVVENRPGANGIIGSETVAKAAPDGYTLLVAPTAHVINPLIYKKLPYDTLRDFASVAYIGSSPGLVLATSPAVPASNAKEFVALAKDGKIAYGSGGIGNFQHLAGEHFNMVTGSKMLHVPYKSAGQAVTGMYTGEVQASFLGPVQAISLFKAGKLKPIAVTSPTRMKQLPDVPTMAESGFPGYELDGGIQAAVYAPAGTPREVVAKLNREINAVMNESAVKERFETLGLEPAGGPPEVLDRLIREKIDAYGKIVRAAKIEAE
jgi:tripartite-type tricarboxylate transporter receptor subunit TctC